MMLLQFELHQLFLITPEKEQFVPSLDVPHKILNVL